MGFFFKKSRKIDLVFATFSKTPFCGEMVIDTYTNIYDRIKVEDICSPVVKTAIKSDEGFGTYNASKWTPDAKF